MTNRERLADAVRGIRNPALRQEIANLVEDGEGFDDPIDAVDAFLEIDDLAETDTGGGWGKYRSQCRRVLIQAGFYLPMTQQDLDNTTVSSGRKYDIKIGGQCYRCAASLPVWLEEK